MGRKLDVDDSFRASETKVGDFLRVVVVIVAVVVVTVVVVTVNVIVAVVVVVDDDSRPCSLLPQMLRDLDGVCIIKL